MALITYTRPSTAEERPMAVRALSVSWTMKAVMAAKAIPTLAQARPATIDPATGSPPAMNAIAASDPITMLKPDATTSPAVSKFIESYAGALVDAGMPRMPARVFIALLAADDGRLTTAELAELLQISPAAIAGAVRYLTQARMVRREREPGSRRDQFVVWDNDWYEMVLRRDDFLAGWMDILREGVGILGPDTPAGVRAAESLAFVEFLHEELPEMMERWRVRREARPSGPCSAPRGRHGAAVRPRARDRVRDHRVRRDGESAAEVEPGQDHAMRVAHRAMEHLIYLG